MGGSIDPWIGDEKFGQSLDQFVLQPHTQPHLFHPAINPLRRMVIVYGRPGVCKKEALEHYCHKIGIPSIVVTVEFARTTAAVDSIQTFVEQQKLHIEAIDAALSASVPTQADEEEGNNVGTVDYAIIIDRFDRLVFEPDNERTMLFVLNLTKMAATNNFMFICLSDRLATEEVHSNLLQTTRMYRQSVFEQFRARAYLPAPHPVYRRTLIQHLINTFVDHMRDQQVDIAIELSEGDYLRLVDYSAYATVDDICNFFRAMFYDLASDDPPPLCRPVDAPKDPETGKPTGPIRITLDVMLDRYLSSATGSPHILSYDPRAIENKYSVDCGRGPIMGTTPVGGTPGIGPDLETTRFSSSLADPTAAKDALKKKKKNKNKNKKRDREDAALWEAEDPAPTEKMLNQEEELIIT
jgi:hypothetical protein